MESIVVDSSIIVASFLANEKNHQHALEYINGLERGDYTFHLPMLASIEVTSAIRRRATRNWIALVSTWNKSVADWERDDMLIMYPLDRDRMNKASDIAARYGFRAQDCIFAELALELNVPFKTFDKELLERFPTASE
ncbi:MAG: type II toxin-antitoxin system VapC family toxin [Chloroflexi bacterium]|nr:type II toxin-antitoxin system VapC family toxin [Chloroflexota bacterium]MCI0810768.1 type II toxin-antitoxin system VapC family toxin [Chloroflexota bacterium]